MNKKNAKSILLKEIDSILPKWWIEMLENLLSIIKHSKFPSFRHAEQFVNSALSDIPKDIDKDKNDVKRILVKCFNKGEHDGKIYITIEAYFHMKNKDLWKLSKSLHVMKRESALSYD